MTDDELESLLRSYQGSAPRPETRDAALRAARDARSGPAPSATVMPAARAPGVLPARRRRRIPRAALWAAAAGLLVAAGVGAGLRLGRPPAKPGDAPAGRVASGRIDLLRDSGRLQAGPGAALLPDDVLAAGVTSVLELADGSSVKLGAGARMRLAAPAAGQRARLELSAGRAFLRVARAPGEFVVAGSAEVHVLGTVFGVEESAGRTSVGVLEGRVALASAGSRLELSRGQSGAASAGGAPAGTAADPNETLRWARAGMTFADQPLSAVLDWVSDNSSYRFKVADVRLLERTVTVTVGDEPIRKVIEDLLGGCGLNHSVEGCEVTIR